MSSTPEVRFDRFADAWEQRKLNQIADIIGGGTPSTANPEYWDGDIDWYAPAEIGEERYADGSVRRITELGLQRSSATILPAGRTILFTSRAGIGKTAILRRSGATNQGFQSIVLRDGINPYFIFSMSDSIKEKAETVASGSTFLEISGKMLGNLDVMIPNKSEQDMIAGCFEALDFLITLYQRKYDTLIAMKAACLDKMFPKSGSKVPELRFAGFTGDWELHELGELVAIKDSARIPNSEWQNSGVPYIRASDISNDDISGVLFISLERYEYYASRTGAPAKGDVLFNGGGEIGKTLLLTSDKPIYVQGGAILYAQTSASASLDGQYLKTYFETTQAQQYIAIASAGGTMKHFTVAPSQEMPIQLPKTPEQIKIGSFFRELDSLITLHQRKLDKLQQLRQALLHKMFV